MIEDEQQSNFRTWALYLLSVLIFLYGLRPLTWWQLRHIPGPWGWWLIGSIPDVLKEGIAHLNVTYAAKFGPVFKVSYAKYAVVVLADPELARGMLRHSPIRPAWWPAADLSEEFHRGMTSSLVLANGPLWKSLRGAWQPMFFSGSLQNCGPLMDQAAQHFVEDIRAASRQGKPTDIHSTAGDMAFDVIAGASLGWKTCAQKTARQLNCVSEDMAWDSLRRDAATFFETASGSLLVVLYMILPFLLPLLQCVRLWLRDSKLEAIMDARHRLLRSIGELDQKNPVGTAMKLQDLRKGIEPGLFFSLLDTVLDPTTNEPLSRYARAQQALVMILAGYETSSSTIANTCYLLAHPQNKAALNCLFAEIETVDWGIRVEEVLRLPYLDAVIKESLRLMPPAHVTAREASRAMDVGGYRIPEGQWVMIPIYAIHRDPKWWGDDAELFRPERWLKADKSEQRRKAFMPFGDGPRSCPGATFALQEAKLAIFRLLQQFNIELDTPEVPLKFRHSATMAVKGGVWVKVQERKCRECTI